MKIGLYFGSFNPVHMGHLIIANHIVNEGFADQVWMIVSPQNPFKKSNTLLNEYHRLHFIQSSVEGESKLKASSVEFKLPRPSYTIDTLTYLQEKHPEHEFSIIMGSDSFSNLSKWKNFELIIKNHLIYIYIRPGFDVVNTIGARIEIIDAPLLEISSTRIRELIKEGKSIRYLVPDQVNEEILNNGYYKSI
ncbi:nicotinate-nucleotide adenylyltransferase [Ferruginibacter lapsinanis]|uniref:nicotinate (nicotinamide) nucleotide adenylyltransferase n=1 Tax=Ferruginibacter lapsinanis TaxID=563172 RepID=UPI0021D44925|nr:nicotinate (nicotinamide) nucleotide adenylyltransferase [Ferruginibacter lapsinanis]UEG50743.1 nicotinate-nucleotide adenylyltransferase [Ferruginibacter lapsinanis]